MFKLDWLEILQMSALLSQFYFVGVCIGAFRFRSTTLFVREVLLMGTYVFCTLYLPLQAGYKDIFKICLSLVAGELLREYIRIMPDVPRRDFIRKAETTISEKRRPARDGNAEPNPIPEPEEQYAPYGNSY